ncbi:MAG: DUF3035 domain-containing protein [Rhodospirillales bacterium]|jgi:hypothetical protein
MSRKLMMRGRLVLMICLPALFLSACGDAKRILSREKRAPDEFAVYQRAPLSQPPDFGLRPPGTNAARPQDPGSTSQASKALSGDNPSATFADSQKATSPATLAFLRQAGVDQAELGVRSIIDRETSLYAKEQGSVVDKIIFWRTTPKVNVLVDPEVEAKRISKRKALGKPVAGGSIPVKEVKKKAIFEGIFD